MNYARFLNTRLIKALYTVALGSFVLKCASKDDEDFFKKTSTAIDFQTWTMWYEHGGPKEYMFPLVSGPDRYV